MAIRCEKCDQPLLEDDVVCWQCGHPVEAPREAASPGETAVEEETKTSGEVLPLSALVVYGVLTLLIIVAVVLVTSFLGRQPRLQPVELELPEDWEQVTDRARTFTLFLPQGWALLDASDTQDIDAAELLNTPTFRQALAPLGNLVRDIQLTFAAAAEPPIAEGNPPGQFLVVARSARLNRLAPTEVVGLARESTVGLLDSAVVDNYDRSHVYLAVELPAEIGGGLLCEQQFISGSNEAMLVSACSARERPDRSTMRQILDSFQRLSP